MQIYIFIALETIFRYIIYVFLEPLEFLISKGLHYSMTGKNGYDEEQINTCLVKLNTNEYLYFC